MPDSYIYICSGCTTPCEGKSKMSYQFKQDVIFAEKTENIVKEDILTKPGVISCSKSVKKTPYPDWKVETTKNNVTIVTYVEVKAQCRTFMSSAKNLKDENGVPLQPSETIALNTSDLVKYIKQYDEEKLDTVVCWLLFNRPCVCGVGKFKLFKQHIKELKRLYELDTKKSRQFTRKIGYGDITESGEHKGVIVNYHFRLSELKEDKKFGARDIPQDILDLKR